MASSIRGVKVLSEVLPRTRFHPDTRLDRGGHGVGSSGGWDGWFGVALWRGERRAASREVRWSARRKEQVVLRLLRGESLDLLARELVQPAGRIAGWREEFLEGGREGLKSRPRPAEQRELVGAQRKVGELQLENDILRALLEKK